MTSDISAPFVCTVNVGVLGVVTLTDLELVLKVAVLAATLVFTIISAWLKWRNRDKHQS